MKSRAGCLLDKSIAAMLAAIEVYNKPNFPHRTDSFAILAFNSWELLLKARILQLDSNRLQAITVYERRTNADGKKSTKLYKKKGRSGNDVTIGLFTAHDRLVNDYSDTIAPVVRTNLEALGEIRDNSVHFMNPGLEVTRKVQEIGTATLKNYVNALRQWFGVDMSRFNFFLMPLAFFSDFRAADGLVLNAEERQLIDYVAGLQQQQGRDDVANDFNLSLEIDVKIKRKSSPSAAPLVRVTDDPNAVTVQFEEKDIREQYPWDYKILTKRLSDRYSDFKNNQTYHQVRQKLENDQRYCTVRLLDPGNPKSSQKKFYSPNIIKEFDGHYSRK